MTPRSTLPLTLPLLALTLTLAGCGPAAVVNSPETYNLGTLEEVGDLYRSVASASKAAPKSVKDLARNRDLFMNGYKAVESGEITVKWGTLPVPGDTETDEILAYKADVPKSGGPVLLKNGTIKTITPNEFK